MPQRSTLSATSLSTGWRKLGGKRNWMASVSGQLQNNQQQLSAINNAGAIFASLSPTSSDNGPALNKFLSDICTYNTVGVLPNGDYAVKTPLIATGGGAALSGAVSGDTIRIYGATAQQQTSNTPGSAAGTQIYWNGSSTGDPLLSMIGVGKLVMQNVGLFGFNNTGHVLYVNQGSGNAPYGYSFYDCVFSGPGNSYACEYTDGTVNTARFMHKSCKYLGNSSAGYTTPVTCNGFQAGNQNSLNHTFETCAFQQCNYAAAFYAGSGTMFRCEFSLNTGADIYVDGGNASGVSAIDCYADFSNRFMYIHNNTDAAQIIKVDGGLQTCSPLVYWAYAMQAFQSGGPNPGACPTGDLASAVIQFDRTGMLRLRDTQFNDPWNGTYPSYLTSAAGWPSSGIVSNVSSGAIVAASATDWLRSGAVACTGTGSGFQRTPGFGSDSNPVTWVTS